MNLLILTLAVPLIAAALGGFVAAWLIPQFGWRAVFYFGGTVPIVIAGLMFFWLPESLQFLVLKQRHLDRLGKWLTLIDPATPTGPGVRYVGREQNKEGAPFVHLLREGRAAGTVTLWIIYFMNLLVLYFFGTMLEEILGTRRFVVAYFSAQLAGALFFLVPGILSRGDIPAIGASGAVMGVMVAMATLRPRQMVIVIFIPVTLVWLLIVGARETPRIRA